MREIDILKENLEEAKESLEKSKSFVNWLEMKIKTEEIKEIIKDK